MAGPAIYLLGHVLFRCGWPARCAGSGWPARSRCCAVGGLGSVIPALATATLVLAILIALIVAEPSPARGAALEGLPSPIEQLQERTRASAA